MGRAPRSWCILSFANRASVMQFFENSWRSPTAPFDYGHTARTPRLLFIPFFLGIPFAAPGMVKSGLRSLLT